MTGTRLTSASKKSPKVKQPTRPKRSTRTRDCFDSTNHKIYDQCKKEGKDCNIVKHCHKDKNLEFEPSKAFDKEYRRTPASKCARKFVFENYEKEFALCTKGKATKPKTRASSSRRPKTSSRKKSPSKKKSPTTKKVSKRKGGFFG
jgi:hypothetical protein